MESRSPLRAAVGLGLASAVLVTVYVAVLFVVFRAAAIAEFEVLLENADRGIDASELYRIAAISGPIVVGVLQFLAALVYGVFANALRLTRRRRAYAAAVLAGTVLGFFVSVPGAQPFVFGGFLAVWIGFAAGFLRLADRPSTGSRA